MLTTSKYPGGTRESGGRRAGDRVRPGVFRRWTNAVVTRPEWPRSAWRHRRSAWGRIAMSIEPPADTTPVPAVAPGRTDEPPGVAEGLFLLHDPDWRRKVFTGGLLLMIPFVGWF